MATEATHDLHLLGCAPSPLAHYLKALGVLRLVSEQKDPTAQGYWAEDHFVLRSQLAEEDLQGFFLEEYEPTPIVAPWNGGSGFYAGHPASRKTLDSIADAPASRLQPIRAAMLCAKEAVAAVGIRKKPDEDKDRLLLQCRNFFPDQQIRWLNAAFALTTKEPKAPPLLGSGGNDGNLELSSNFRQVILRIINPTTGGATPRSSAWLRSALWATSAPGLLSGQAIGQFQPGAAGGPNMTAGFDAESLTNPWDFVFMLEGAILFAAAATRRFEQVGPAMLSYPFTVRSTGAGTGNVTGEDASTDNSRAEMWLPLWSRPAGLAEIGALLAEGRATVSRRTARDGADFARAVASLGVDRGITAFERYSFMKRNGRSYLAVPLGRWEVTPRPNVDLLTEVDGWFGRFQQVARDPKTPNSFRRAAHGIEEAIMAVCRTPGPLRWQDLLIALGEAEKAMSVSPQTTLGGNQRQALRPLPRLSQSWLAACDDGSPELRLAAGLASIRAQEHKIGPLRANMVPLDRKKPGRFNEEAHMRDNAVVWSDDDLVDNLLAVLQRRYTDAERLDLKASPLEAVAPVALADVSRFIAGQVDERRLEQLLWGLNAIVWDEQTWHLRDHDGTAPPLPAAYCLLKLLFVPDHLATGPDGQPRAIPFTPAVLHLAAAGRMSEASQGAVRRLRGSGLRPALEVLAGSPELSRRIAAALLFPVSSQDVLTLARRVLRRPDSTTKL